MDRKRESVLAGESKTFESDYPMLITFDRGDGNKTAKRRIDGGLYSVAIDRSSKLLDLFTETQLASEAPKAEREEMATHKAPLESVKRDGDSLAGKFLVPDGRFVRPP